MSTHGLLSIALYMFALLISGIISILFLSLTVISRREIYLQAFFLSSVGLLFFTGNALQLYYGSFLFNFHTAFLWNYLKNLSVYGYFFTAFPYINKTLQSDYTKTSVHRGMWYAFTAIGILLLLFSIMDPESFKSLELANAATLPYRELWGTSQNGPLMNLRNIFLMIMIAYIAVLMILSEVKSRRSSPQKIKSFESVEFSGFWFLAGLFLLIIMGAMSMIQDSDLLLNVFGGYFPFFGLGVSLFSIMVLAQVLHSIYRDALRSRDLQLSNEVQREELDFLATHDSASGMLNEGYFLNRLEQYFRRKLHLIPEKALSLVFFHWANFNDLLQTRGLDFIYQTISSISETMKDVMPAGSEFYRLTRDDFAVIIPDPDVDKTAHSKAGTTLPKGMRELQRIIDNEYPRSSLDAYLHIKQSLMHIPRDAANFDSAVRGISILLGKTRSLTGSQPYILTTNDVEHSMDGIIRFRDQMEIIRTRTITYALQPICNTDRSISAVELLTRIPGSAFWTDPGHFYQFAEQSGSMVDLSSLIFESASLELKQLLERGKTVSIHINLTPQQLSDPAFLDRHLPFLLATGYPAEKLCFEITENSIIENLDETLPKVHRIREMGCTISLDDFGSGYSSLRYLTELPIDSVKVDRHFAQVVKDDPAVAILKAVVDICRNYGLDTIIEGVETEFQFQRAIELGYTRIQGYYLHRPMPVEQLIELL